jgi:hypothetical protein
VWGGGGTARIGLRLDDVLQLEATGSAVGGTTLVAQSSGLAWAALVGLRCSLPVLQLEPSVHLAFGAVGLARLEAQLPDDLLAPPAAAMAIGAGLAVDWRVTRSWAVGLEVEFRSAVTALDRLPMWVSVGPRVEWRGRPRVPPRETRTAAP